MVFAPAYPVWSEALKPHLLCIPISFVMLLIKMVIGDETSQRWNSFPLRSIGWVGLIRGVSWR